MAKATLGGFIVSDTDPIDSRIVFNTYGNALTGLTPSSAGGTGRPSYKGLMVFITGESKIYYVSNVTANLTPTLTEFNWSPKAYWRT